MIYTIMTLISINFLNISHNKILTVSLSIIKAVYQNHCECISELLNNGALVDENIMEYCHWYGETEAKMHLACIIFSRVRIY